MPTPTKHRKWLAGQIKRLAGALSDDNTFNAIYDETLRGLKYSYKTGKQLTFQLVQKPKQVCPPRQLKLAI